MRHTGCQHGAVQ